MKKGIVALFILVAAATAASYELLTPPDSTRNLAESSESLAPHSGGWVLLDSAVTLQDCPTDANLGQQGILAIVTASAGPDEEAEEAEEREEDGKEKEAEEGAPDRMWGAVKLG